MGLIDLVNRAAASRAHVLVAEVPGAFQERVALERAIDRRGWCLAGSAADADVLAVVGEPDDAFAAVVEHAWAQLSEPRVRIRVRAGARTEHLLDEAAAQIRGTARRTDHPHPAATSEDLPLAEGAEDRDGL